MNVRSFWSNSYSLVLSLPSLTQGTRNVTLDLTGPLYFP